MTQQRLCLTCNTPLSDYNKGNYCFCHTEGMLVKEHYNKNKSGFTLFNFTEHSDYLSKDFDSGQFNSKNNDGYNFYFGTMFVGVVIDNEGTVAYFE